MEDIMGFSLQEWIENYKTAVQKEFKDRVWFLGLQGSYGRGEATEQSDIDVVLILDALSCKDLDCYSKMLDKLPNRNKVCGFVSGKSELFRWEISELFQFYYDTTPIIGSLDEIISKINDNDIHRAVRIGVCNIYHMCVHNIVHEKNADILKDLYKSAGFVLQAIAFLNTRRYEKKKTELQFLLESKDKCILKSEIELKNIEKLSDESFKKYSEMLFRWASEKIREV